MEDQMDDERGMEISWNAGFSMYEDQISEEPYDDERCRVLESSSRIELGICEDHAIQEPYEGMEFESEDAAKIFYDEYARHVGFVMRVMSCRRSERDGRILARRLGCNKEGHCVSIRGKFGPVRKPRPSTREGCKAMIHVKYNKSGKWVITKFVKDHNHPLVVSPREARQTMVGENETRQVRFMERYMRSHWNDSRTILKKPLVLTEFGKSKKDEGFNISERDSYMNFVYSGIYDLAIKGGTLAGGLVWQLMDEGMDSYFDGYEILLSQNNSTNIVISQQSSKMSQLQSNINIPNP